MVMNDSEIELAKSEVKMVKKNPINELQALLVQVQKLNSTMQQFGDFEVMRPIPIYSHIRVTTFAELLETIFNHSVKGAK